MRGHVNLFLRGLLHGIIKGRPSKTKFTDTFTDSEQLKRLCTQTKYCSFSLGSSDLKELGKRIPGRIGRHYDESAHDNLQKKWDLNQKSSTDPTCSNSASGRTHSSPPSALKILETLQQCLVRENTYRYVSFPCCGCATIFQIVGTGSGSKI